MIGTNPVRMDAQQTTVLVCPKCGFNYLHQTKTDVYNRIEDADLGLHVKADAASVETSTGVTPSDGNPSPRRQGLVIEFECEGCSSKPRLAIYQHKGQTYIEWQE